MTKTQRPKGSKKRKGGRLPVAFVEHPDTGEAVQGLRIHKSTGRYYRIGDDKKSRHHYLKSGRVGLAYLRRAIYEHECWQQGQEPSDRTSLPLSNPLELPRQLDAPHLLPAISAPTDNLQHFISLHSDDLCGWVRDQLGNPATRKEFSERVGIPELQNIHSLPPIVAPLTLQDIIDRYRTRTCSRGIANAPTFVIQ